MRKKTIMVKTNYKMVSSTRICGNGELSNGNLLFKIVVKDSGTMFPKYGRALKVHCAKLALEQLFNI